MNFFKAICLAAPIWTCASSDYAVSAEPFLPNQADGYPSDRAFRGVILKPGTMYMGEVVPQGEVYRYEGGNIEDFLGNIEEGAQKGSVSEIDLSLCPFGPEEMNRNFELLDEISLGNFYNYILKVNRESYNEIAQLLKTNLGNQIALLLRVIKLEQQIKTLQK